jgi:hypothetical protein
MKFIGLLLLGTISNVKNPIVMTYQILGSRNVMFILLALLIQELC